MKKYRWQILIIFLTGIIVGILLLSERPETPVPGSSEDIVPVQGGVYTEALIGEFQRLNPILDTYNDADRSVDALIFSSLIKFDDRGLPVGDLAESWGISQNGTLYNFTLRDDIFWHDGQQVTSNDVLFTIELLRSGGMTIPKDVQEFWQGIEVTVLNERNFQIRLPEPYSPFLDYLTFKILPSHLLGEKSYNEIINDDFNVQPIGSGPYVFSKLVLDQDYIIGVELVYNPAYHEGSAFIETLVFLYYPDVESAWQSYLDGVTQGVSGLGNGEILQQALKDEDISVYSSRLPQFTTVFLNLDNSAVEWMSDITIRKALLMGINRAEIVDKIYNGQAVITDSPILPGTWSYYKVGAVVEYDPAAANDLLVKNGYELTERESDGKVIRQKGEEFLSLILLYPDEDFYEQIALLIQEGWTQLGFEVTIEPVPYDQLINDRLAQRDYETALVDINLARTPDPDPYPFWNQVQATTGQNYSQWNHKMASEYLEKARVTVDIAERTRFYHNFQVIFNQELPSLILFYPIHNYGISKEIQGVRVGPLFDVVDRFNALPDWFLEATFVQ